MIHAVTESYPFHLVFKLTFTVRLYLNRGSASIENYIMLSTCQRNIIHSLLIYSNTCLFYVLTTTLQTNNFAWSLWHEYVVVLLRYLVWCLHQDDISNSVLTLKRLTFRLQSPTLEEIFHRFPYIQYMLIAM